MELNKIIYFDSASKTIPYNEVIENYNETLKENFANPSSIHFEGVKANRKLDIIRKKIQEILSLPNHNVIFTSCASESNNLSIKGSALRYKNRGNHIICSYYEHASVKEAFEHLKNNFGFEVTYIMPNDKGVITLESIKNSIKPSTILVSIMAVNNEVGSINPIAEIAKELKQYPKILFHVDAAQAIGKVKIDYSNVDMITISSHKIHGLPSGGCLLVKKNIELMPLINGGGQEFGLRSGTVDVATCSAFAVALLKSMREFNSHLEKVCFLANKIYKYLESKPDLYHINSSLDNPYIINFSTINKKSSVVVEALSSRGIMVSSTSACSSYKQKGSYVVKSIFNDDNIANNTIRVSFSYLNTIEEVEILINELDKIIGEIR